MRKKGFLFSHAKSSAALISLAIHATLIVAAFSFVAVTVITKEDKAFEAKTVSRPKMQLKKLQVPVNVKKKPQKPTLRRRIVVTPRMNQRMPDIRMPEITGVRGGIGNAGDGLGAAGLGFSMPEIQVFGIRSKGEKIFIALDSDQIMLSDKLGGVLAYQIIKAEVAKIIEGLSPTTLFNLGVFDHSRTTMLFPRMVPATEENVARVGKWLAPLNEFVVGRTSKAYGVATIGEGGTSVDGDFKRGKIVDMNGPPRGLHWYPSAAVAMREQADTTFILSGWWGVLRKPRGAVPKWSEAGRKLWEQKVKEALLMQKEENEKRAARGEPPQVTRDEHQLVIAWFGMENFLAWRKPEPEWYNFTGKEFAESIHIYRKENAGNIPAKSGVGSREKDKFSVNVIYFMEKDAESSAGGAARYEQVARLCNGQFRRVEGLEGIKSSVSGSGK